MKDQIRQMKSIQLKKAKRHAAAGHIVWAPVASKIISSALATASDTTFSALEITSIISRRSDYLQTKQVQNCSNA